MIRGEAKMEYETERFVYFVVQGTKERYSVRVDKTTHRTYCDCMLGSLFPSGRPVTGVCYHVRAALKLLDEVSLVQ